MMLRRIGLVTILFLATLPRGFARTTVWGPTIYTSNVGAPAQDTRPFQLPADEACGASAFLLSVENGGAGTVGPVASATVMFDGRTVFSERDFSAVASRMERWVQATQGTHSVTVEIKGSKPGSAIAVSIHREIETSLIDVTHILTGKQDSYIDSFTTNGPGTWVLELIAGDGSGQHRPKTFSISMNGAAILTEKDTVDGAVRRSIAPAGSNALASIVKGDPGDRLLIRVRRVIAEDSCGPRVSFTTPSDREIVRTSW